MKVNQVVMIEGKPCEFAGMIPSFICELPTYKIIATNRYFYLDTDGEFHEYDNVEEWKNEIEGAYLFS